MIHFWTLRYVPPSVILSARVWAIWERNGKLLFFMTALFIVSYLRYCCVSGCIDGLALGIIDTHNNNNRKGRLDRCVCVISHLCKLNLSLTLYRERHRSAKVRKSNCLPDCGEHCVSRLDYAIRCHCRIWIKWVVGRIFAFNLSDRSSSNFKLDNMENREVAKWYSCGIEIAID